MKFNLTYGIIAICSTAAIACSGQYEASSDELTTEQTSQEIRGGTLQTQMTEGPQDQSTVRIAGCTGLKIGPRRFLTAAHCFSPADIGTRKYITNGLNGRGSEPNYRVTNVLRHPTFWNSVNNNLPFWGYDIALLDIDSDTPIPTWTVFRPTTTNSGVPLRVLGYGCDTLNTSPERWGLKQSATFTSGSFGSLESDIFTIWSRAEPQVCSGDSGGPVFEQLQGLWHVVGVVGGTGSNTSGNPGSYFLRTNNIRSWLRDPNHNVIGGGRKGFFINRISNKCIALGSSNGTQAFCNGSNVEITGTDQQYWRLVSDVSINGVPHYKIQNTQNGKCLATVTVATPSGTVRIVPHLTCPTGHDPKFSFQFPTGVNGNYRMIRSATNSCVAAANTTNGSALTHAACSAGTESQNWIYSM